MLFNLANILLFLVLAAGFLVVTLTAGRIVRPNVPNDPHKRDTYECGEKPLTKAWFNFNPRFYIVALVFLIFDVEIAFTYPVGVALRRWVADGAGGAAVAELLVFMAILALGLAYVWVKGDLEWLKRVVTDDNAERVGAGAPPATTIDAAPAADAPTTEKAA